MRRLRLDLNRPLPTRLREFRFRMLLVALVFFLASALLVWRVYDLHVLQHKTLSRLAQRQSQRTFKIKGKRGAIYDSRGGRLAASLKSRSFYAHPALVSRPAETAARLAPLLELPVLNIQERLRSKKPFIWLKRQVTPAQARAVDALELSGVESTPEYRRIYPARELAASLLGFTGVDSQGLEGLEYAYDSYLRGAEHLRVVSVDALGRSYLHTQQRFPSGGGSLHLTIHPAVQYIAETELAAAVKHWQAKVGIAIVMRSDTGEILAMAQSPGFNANAYREYDKERYFNRAVTSGYEPGSTFKVITTAIALDTEAVRPDSLFYCEQGSMEHYDSTIHDTKPHDWLNLAQVIQVSSNICAAKVGLSVPVPVFHRYVDSFGFGKRLKLFNASDGRRLAGEAEGRVLPSRRWTPVDHAAISFGHGILASPLQLVLAVNTIATGGVRLQPLLVREIRDSRGRVLEKQQPRVLGRIISPGTAARVRDFMIGVVSPEGTGGRAAVPGYRVAGKTGTTEKYDIEARGYSKTRLIASFVGFVPAQRPVLTILVLVEEPAEGRYGGVVAAPVFRNIVARVLPLLGVWPRLDAPPAPPSGG